MLKRSIGSLMVLVMSVTIVLAQEKKESGISSWFKELQKKIDVIAPRKSMPVSTGVAGVRGAKDDSARNKLYWKGKKGDEPVTEEELKEFKEAIDFVEADRKPEAMHEFEEFLKLYPDSALIPDAKKSLDLLKAETMAEAKTEIKAEPKAETKTETKAVTTTGTKAEAK